MRQYAMILKECGILTVDHIKERMNAMRSLFRGIRLISTTRIEPPLSEAENDPGEHRIATLVLGIDAQQRSAVLTNHSNDLRSFLSDLHMILSYVQHTIALTHSLQ
jgi:hypothetical protein